MRGFLSHDANSAKIFASVLQTEYRRSWRKSACVASTSCATSKVHLQKLDQQHP
jgi:hypothetical protein